MGHSLVMSNMFSLAFGLVPPADIPSVWGTVATWGLEQMGDYGAFWYVLVSLTIQCAKSCQVFLCIYE